MTAYNYLTQRWVEGPGARNLRHDQCLEELSLLRGLDGERYAKMCGITDCESAIGRLEKEARELHNAG